MKYYTFALRSQIDISNTFYFMEFQRCPFLFYLILYSGKCLIASGRKF